MRGAGALAPRGEPPRGGQDDECECKGERGEAPLAQRVTEDDVFEDFEQVFHARAL